MSIEENFKMVSFLVEDGHLRTPEVIEAFKKVDRALFVPLQLKSSAYYDEPLSIGFSQTISAPSMVAIMTEALKVGKGMKVLEIGAGSGYQAAILSKLVGSKGKIYTIERIREVAEFSRKNLEKYRNVNVIVADGTLGYEKNAPYDRIIVTAAAPKIPSPLIEQLKADGILAVPVGNRFCQDFVLVKKSKEGKIEEKFICGCVFVPLIGKYGMKEDY